MSDSTSRRGTDYESLRAMGAGRGGRAPESADDPLAELARLVSQNDSSRREPAPQREQRQPRLDYPASSDRLDPPAYEPSSRDFDARGFGAAPSARDYPDSDDFFADVAAPRRAGDEDFGRYRDDPFAFEDDQRRDPYYEDDDFDPAFQQQGYDDEYDDQPVSQGRSKVKLIGMLLGLVVVGGVGAWAYGAMTGGGDNTGSGEAPVIKADNETPVKVIAETPPAARQKEIYDRVDPNASATVVPSVEEPGEKPTPRVILPGASQGNMQDRVNVPAASDEVQTDPNAGRRVRTIAIRPDGTPEPQQPEAMTPPPVIQGTGEAQGMSMQLGEDGGILSSEGSPSSSASVSVPMPQPRPSGIQAPAYAAPSAAPSYNSAPAYTPAPQAAQPVRGGPPSSPQPNVNITNDRVLRPSGPPPAPQPGARPLRPAASAPSNAPAAARAVQSQQIAAASPVPLAPQVAAVSSNAGARGGFSVQLASLPSEAEAHSTYAALQQRHPQLLGGVPMTLQRADLQNGTFYRVRVMQPSQEAAANLCINIKNAGGQCIVQRN